VARIERTSDSVGITLSTTQRPRIRISSAIARSCSGGSGSIAVRSQRGDAARSIERPRRSRARSTRKMAGGRRARTMTALMSAVLPR
jgi:hypothetical protein